MAILNYRPYRYLRLCCGSGPRHHIDCWEHGDIIVFGSKDQTDYRPRAARVTAQGDLGALDCYAFRLHEELRPCF